MRVVLDVGLLISVLCFTHACVFVIAICRRALCCGSSPFFLSSRELSAYDRTSEYVLLESREHDIHTGGWRSNEKGERKRTIEWRNGPNIRPTYNETKMREGGLRIFIFLSPISSSEKDSILYTRGKSPTFTSLIPIIRTSLTTPPKLMMDLPKHKRAKKIVTSWALLIVRMFYVIFEHTAHENFFQRAWSDRRGLGQVYSKHRLVFVFPLSYETLTVGRIQKKREPHWLEEVCENYSRFIAAAPVLLCSDILRLFRIVRQS